MGYGYRVNIPPGKVLSQLTLATLERPPPGMMKSYGNSITQHQSPHSGNTGNHLKLFHYELTPASDPLGRQNGTSGQQQLYKCGGHVHRWKTSLLKTHRTTTGLKISWSISETAISKERCKRLWPDAKTGRATFICIWPTLLPVDAVLLAGGVMQIVEAWTRLRLSLKRKKGKLGLECTLLCFYTQIVLEISLEYAVFP